MSEMCHKGFKTLKLQNGSVSCDRGDKNNAFNTKVKKYAVNVRKVRNLREEYY
jgi:hypothetical protein